MVSVSLTTAAAPLRLLLLGGAARRSGNATGARERPKAGVEYIGGGVSITCHARTDRAEETKPVWRRVAVGSAIATDDGARIGHLDFFRAGRPHSKNGGARQYADPDFIDVEIHGLTP